MVSTHGRQWTIFFTYTLWSVLIVIVMVPLGLMLVINLTVPETVNRYPLPSLVLGAQVVLGAWSAHAAMRSWAVGNASAHHGRWDLPQVGRLSARPWTVVISALPSLLMLALVVVSAAPSWLLLIALGVLSASALLRVQWWWGLLAAVGLGLLFGPLGLSPYLGPAFSGIVVAATSAGRSSLWLAAVVRELDEARTAQSQLAVAEERLRFARDLHDVTGRDLSAIAVTSELVAQLVEREDRRALEHSREVAQIARTSLAEIRALVRGYREVDLDAELQGTVSLLRSAKVDVGVHGSADAIPDRHDQLAAWVLREGGTNMLRHSAPRHVTIRLETDGIRLTNDGAPSGAAVTEGSGLTGLRERLGRAATLSTHLEGGVFTLDVTFAGAAATTDPAHPEERS